MSPMSYFGRSKLNFNRHFSVSYPLEGQSNGRGWQLGIFRYQVEGRNILLAAAKARGGIPILLWPGELDAAGKVGRCELYTILGGRFQPVDGSELPPQLTPSLRQLADQENAFGVLADFSLSPKESDRPVHDSHAVAAGGVEGTVQVIHYKDSDLAGLALPGGGHGASRYFQLNVQEINEDGHIARAVLQQEVKGEWKVVPDDAIPAPMLQALYRFAHRHHLFGVAQQQYDQQIAKTMDRMALHHDMDGELATLLSRHYEAKLNEALDNKDKAAFEELAPMAKAYKEAAEALNKPRHHADRIAFERKQAAALSKAKEGHGR